MNFAFGLSSSTPLPLSLLLLLPLHSFSLSPSPLLSFILFLPFLFASVPILLCLWPAPHSLIPSPSTLPRLSAPPSCAAAVYNQAMEAAARMLRGPRATGEDDADAERPLSLGPLSRPSSTARCISPFSSLLYSLSLSLLLSGSAHSRGSFSVFLPPPLPPSCTPNGEKSPSQSPQERLRLSSCLRPYTPSLFASASALRLAPPLFPCVPLPLRRASY